MAISFSNGINIGGSGGGSPDGANKDLSNLTTTGKKVIDGQYTPIETVQVAKNISYDPTATDPTPYSIATALPNDNSSYMLLLRLATTSNASGKYCVPIYSDYQTQFINAALHTNMSWSNYTSQEYIWLPVGAARTLYIKPLNWVGTGGVYSIDIVGYRRLGTNN